MSMVGLRHRFWLMPSLLGCALLWLCPAALAQLISPLNIRVNVIGKDDRPEGTYSIPGGKQERAGVKQTRTLEILITNRSQTNFEQLTMKYYLLGRDHTSGDIKVVHATERDISLPPLGAEKIESREITYNWQRRHRKFVKGKTETVAASGVEYLGYAVRVFQGDKVVGEDFLPSGMKEQIIPVVQVADTRPPRKGR
jgi:hypothetical protein